jgi:Arm DNA-binding domain
LRGLLNGFIHVAPLSGDRAGVRGAADGCGIELTDSVEGRQDQRAGRYGDGGGLYLRVAEYRLKDGTLARSKNWLFRFERDGRERQMGLGSLDTLSLADARAKARDCRKALLEGIDPINARRARRHQSQLDVARTITFKACAERYISAHRKGWKNPVHAAQWPATLSRYVYPIIGHLPVASIDTALVTKCIEPIWTEKPETAGNGFARPTWCVLRNTRGQSSRLHPTIPAPLSVFVGAYDETGPNTTGGNACLVLPAQLRRASPDQRSLGSLEPR